MKVLVVGGGGREHALCWKLSQEVEVHAAPGNPGIASVAECHSVGSAYLEGQVRLAKHLGVDLVVVGPENPLIAGLADRLRAERVPVFGPGAEAAQLEGSKAFSKRAMAEAGVPTADFKVFDDAMLASEFARARYGAGASLVVKASGAALGKGAVMCPTLAEALEAIDSMLVRGDLGEAGKTLVLEECLPGREFSLLTVCSDQGIASLPLAQDYKRIFDGDEGPNTGGMGSYSPVSWVNETLVGQTEAEVVQPILDWLKGKGLGFRGMLFSGIMAGPEGPKCLEYNVRFGDPETQSVMLRLGDGFADLLRQAALGEPLAPSPVLDNAAVTVVLASEGYPGAVQKGRPITVPKSLRAGVQIFHSGTQAVDGVLSTAGGRVLAVSASAEDLSQARQLAYDVCADISFEGMQLRSDIALAACT